ncbi:MAG: hypothetical protein HY049_04445 [Acidobacteria bacterium]|nr:hypothetical protein [Acidobacteriota bacterium]
MKVALGFKAHSGWAALVVVGRTGGDVVVVDRRRVELVEEAWAKQPYHAAENLPAKGARETVTRGIEAAHRIALREMRAAVTRESERGHVVAACAVVAGNPMPGWSVEEILAVHFRMHKAEGALFRDALARAAEGCGLKLAEVPEKQLVAHAGKAIPKPAGPPWGKDQKDAALAARIALEGARLATPE